MHLLFQLNYSRSQQYYHKMLAQNSAFLTFIIYMDVSFSFDLGTERHLFESGVIDFNFLSFSAKKELFLYLLCSKRVQTITSLQKSTF